MENEVRKLSQVEIVYNYIILIITLATIVLLAVPIIILTIKLIAFLAEFIGGIFGGPAKPEILISVPFVGAFAGIMVLPIVVAAIIVQIVLIVMAVKFRKVKTREARGYEFIYWGCMFALMTIGFVFFEILGADGGFWYKIPMIALGAISLGVQVGVFLLIIVLTNKKPKKK